MVLFESGAEFGFSALSPLAGESWREGDKNTALLYRELKCSTDPEPRCDRIGLKTVRFLYGRANKGIPGQVAVAAPQSDDATGQSAAQLPARGLAAHMAGIQTDVEFLSMPCVPAQVVAQYPAVVAGQKQFAVESTHGVTPADGETVLRHQWCAA